MPDQCEMIIGFLVPHRCDNAGLGKCGNCGRTYCDEHMSVTPQGLRCLACQQGLQQPIALPITAPPAPAWSPYHTFTQDNFFNPAATAFYGYDRVSKGGVTLDQLAGLLQCHPAKAHADFGDVICGKPAARGLRTGGSCGPIGQATRAWPLLSGRNSAASAVPISFMNG